MLRLFIFFPIFLLSQDFFMLPDQADHLIHSYNSDIKKAKERVYILSPDIDEYLLLKTLRMLARQKIKLIIITGESLDDSRLNTEKQNRDSAGYLSLLENISVYVLKSLNKTGIEGSLICIDNEKLYLLSQSLEQKKMKQVYSLASYQETECDYIFKTLLQRSKEY